MNVFVIRDGLVNIVTNAFHIGIVQIKAPVPVLLPMTVFVHMQPIQSVIFTTSHLQVFVCILLYFLHTFFILARVYLFTSETYCNDDEGCSYNGSCNKGKCICFPGFFGSNCKCKFYLFYSSVVTKVGIFCRSRV